MTGGQIHRKQWFYEMHCTMKSNNHPIAVIHEILLKLTSNNCNMNPFFSFDLFMVYIVYQNVSNRSELWNNTRRNEISHTSDLGCCFITLSEMCNNQLPRCDIAWLHVTSDFLQRLCVRLFDRLTRKTVGQILHTLFHVITH